MAESTSESQAPAAPSSTHEERISDVDRILSDREDSPLPFRPGPDESAPAGNHAADPLLELRRFHLGGPAPSWGEPPEPLLPALLSAFRGPKTLRHDYPLFVYAGPSASEGSVSAVADSTATGSTSGDSSAVAAGGDAEPLCHPLSDLLPRWIEDVASSGGARILTDNRERLERDIMQVLAETGGASRASDVVGAAGRKMRAELDLDAENTERLERDLTRLLERMPAEAWLLAHDPNVFVRLLVAAAERIVRPARAKLAAQIETLCGELDRLLAVERAKDPGDAPDAVRGALGTAGAAYVDSSRLAELVGRPAGSRPMGAERRERVEGVVRELRAYLEQSDLGRQPCCIAIRADSRGEIPEAAGRLLQVHDADPTRAATRRFDEEALRLTRVLAAMRTGRLERDSRFDPAQHGPWLEQFDWQSFSDDELHLLPAVVAMETPARLAGDLVALSQLLLSSRPVHVVVRNEEVAPLVPQLELGYLAVSHRTAFVQQSSESRPSHLAEGLARGFASPRPSLHLIGAARPTSDAAQAVGAWLLQGAVLEGRALPLFSYDPGRGDTWAQRFQIDGNPQPESAWPVYHLHHRDANGEPATTMLPFTFGDLALLDPAARAEIRRVPRDVASEESLRPLHEYLELEDEDAARTVPYVWAADSEGRLERYVLTRALAFAARDRLDFWHTLQELAGVQNQYVLEAIEHVRREVDEAGRADLEKLRKEHAAELERVRGAAAAESMQALAQALVSGDASSFRAGAGPLPLMPAAALPASAPGGEAAPADAPAEAPGAEGEPAPAAEPSEDPWIDTVLCTSCNECTNLNPQLFVYDENKQARIGDPSAGTFKQLVQAAETCPARCIHPGMPRDPSEPGLEKLIERARKFN